MVQSVKGARIACLDVNLQKSKMQFGVQARAGRGVRARLWGCAGSRAVQEGVRYKALQASGGRDWRQRGKRRRRQVRGGAGAEAGSGAGGT